MSAVPAAVIFDMDGTLLRLDGGHRAVRTRLGRALRRRGVTAPFRPDPPPHPRGRASGRGAGRRRSGPRARRASPSSIASSCKRAQRRSRPHRRRRGGHAALLAAARAWRMVTDNGRACVRARPRRRRPCRRRLRDGDRPATTCRAQAGSRRRSRRGAAPLLAGGVALVRRGHAARHRRAAARRPRCPGLRVAAVAVATPVGTSGRRRGPTLSSTPSTACCRCAESPGRRGGGGSVGSACWLSARWRVSCQLHDHRVQRGGDPRARRCATSTPAWRAFGDRAFEILLVDDGSTDRTADDRRASWRPLPRGAAHPPRPRTWAPARRS